VLLNVCACVQCQAMSQFHAMSRNVAGRRVADCLRGGAQRGVCAEATRAGSAGDAVETTGDEVRR
jgi:hypothetical protein